MRSRRYLAVLFVLVPTGTSGQNIAQRAWYDVKHAGLDMIHVWTGPFHASQSDWAMAGVVLGVAGLASIWDDDIDAWIARHQDGALVDATKAFRDPPLVHLGSGHRMMKLLAVVWGTGVVVNSRTLRDAGIGCMASIQANAILRSVLYKSIARTRPLVADGNQYEFGLPGKDWDFHAFPAGHGANAHACATFLSDRFDPDWLVLGLHAAAAGVSFGRMVDRRHWLSDAIIGTAIGVSIGRSIAIRSLGRAEKSRTHTNGGERGPPPLQLLPGDAGGIVILYTIRF